MNENVASLEEGVEVSFSNYTFHLPILVSNACDERCLGLVERRFCISKLRKHSLNEIYSDQIPVEIPPLQLSFSIAKSQDRQAGHRQRPSSHDNMNDTKERERSNGLKIEELDWHLNAQREISPRRAGSISSTG